ncbi:MAG: hypothetical protein J0L93_03555 [Deltaproteobacteria bacterium]|nr:hypothetical protein [Deltaproteobacteria bacterium]
MSDEREKKSWAEIDSARNRGVKATKSVSKADAREQKLASSAAKKKLEALFSSSPLSKEKAAKLNEIHKLRLSDRNQYYQKMSEYLKDYGTPREWDAQLFFLDHRDVNVVCEILDELKKTAPRENLSRQDVLGSKLKVMSLSTFDSKLLDKIKEVQVAILKT